MTQFQSHLLLVSAGLIAGVLLQTWALRRMCQAVWSEAKFWLARTRMWRERAELAEREIDELRAELPARCEGRHAAGNIDELRAVLDDLPEGARPIRQTMEVSRE